MSDSDDTILVLQVLICYARCHMVEELCLDTCNIVYFSWPCCLLDCSSLAVLKITCKFVEDWGALKLPSLRVLEISECGSEHMDLKVKAKYKGIKMFSGCPNLESLVLIDYLAESACICVPELENLEFCVSPERPLTFPYIELCTPNLRSVKFSNVLPTVESALEFWCIHRVNIEVKDCNFESRNSQSQKSTANFSELLRVFHNATSLTLPSKAIEVNLKLISSPLPSEHDFFFAYNLFC